MAISSSNNTTKHHAYFPNFIVPNEAIVHNSSWKFDKTEGGWVVQKPNMSINSESVDPLQ